MDVHVVVDRRGVRVVAADATPTVTGAPAVVMRLCDPDAVDRTTGAIRDVHAIVQLGVDVLAPLLATCSLPVDAGVSAVAVMVHRLSRRAVMVGPFPTATDAHTWWSWSRNRIAARPAIAFIVLTMSDRTG